MSLSEVEDLSRSKRDSVPREALIIADQNHVALKVVASEKEHPLLTTDPKEIFPNA